MSDTTVPEPAAASTNDRRTHYLEVLDQLFWDALATQPFGLVFGDGTRDILRRLRIDWVWHYIYGLEPATQENAEVWLDALPQLVQEKVFRAVTWCSTRREWIRMWMTRSAEV